MRRKGQKWSLKDEELVPAVERKFGEIVVVTERRGFRLKYILEWDATPPHADGYG